MRCPEVSLYATRLAGKAPVAIGVSNESFHHASVIANVNVFLLFVLIAASALAQHRVDHV